ncbi:hypothetical protein, partial [Streptomyces roseolus]|uniref:hypothetical protein n=1 Tax=Streptomyces roseolus TaxID=67358 RepID=UPI00366966AD
MRVIRGLAAAGIALVAGLAGLLAVISFFIVFMALVSGDAGTALTYAVFGAVCLCFVKLLGVAANLLGGGRPAYREGYPPARRGRQRRRSTGYGYPSGYS